MAEQDEDEEDLEGVDIPLQFNPGDLNVQRSDGSTVMNGDGPQTVRGFDPDSPVQVSSSQVSQGAGAASSATNGFLRFVVK